MHPNRTQDRETNPYERYMNILDECMNTIYTPQDTTHLKHIRNELDERDMSIIHTHMCNDEYDNLQEAIHQMKNKATAFDENIRDQAVRFSMVQLLSSLDISDASNIVGQCGSLDDIAGVIMKYYEDRETNKDDQRKDAGKYSNRYIHAHTNGGNEKMGKGGNGEYDDVLRENKRLKELVVKLQNEINENFKKNTDTIIKELFEENQNLQRKISDLIDQLKRKEQEILLIPVDKVAQTKIDGLEKEKKNLLSQIEEINQIYNEEISELNKELNNALRNTSHTAKSNKQMSKPAEVQFSMIPRIIADPSIDIEMIDLIRQQKSTISQLNSLVESQRKEISNIREDVGSLQGEKNHVMNMYMILDNYVSSFNINTKDIFHNYEEYNNNVSNNYENGIRKDSNSMDSMNEDGGNDGISDTVEQLKSIQKNIKKIKEDFKR